MTKVCLSVFTKPWKDISLDRLCEHVKALGFDGVEYPLREGFQIEPKEGAEGIIRLAETMNKYNLKITSIAGNIGFDMTPDGYHPDCTTKELFEGCKYASVPIVRIMLGYDKSKGFAANFKDFKMKMDAVYPLCVKNNVTVGIQHHCGYYVFGPAELYLLVKDYDPKYIAAVWDSGHNGLSGTEPDISLDMLWDYLCMVNFKAGYYRLITGEQAREAVWKTYWTTGRHGNGSWSQAVKFLRNKRYDKTVCMTAEYSDTVKVNEYIKEDIRYIKELFYGN